MLLYFVNWRIRVGLFLVNKILESVSKLFYFSISPSEFLRVRIYCIFISLEYFSGAICVSTRIFLVVKVIESFLVVIFVFLEFSLLNLFGYLIFWYFFQVCNFSLKIPLSYVVLLTCEMVLRDCFL